MSTLALIGLGSNLGDRKAHLDAALAALGKTPGIRVQRASSYHATSPVGGPAGQGTYLNASASLDTTLAPLDLLQVLQDLEQQAGRVRTVRWGERPLDLDLLLFGDEIIDIKNPHNTARELVVPHPRMAFRRFVLAPSAEVAPEAVEPWTGKTVFSLLANLDRRPSYVAIHDPSRRFGTELFRHLVDELRSVAISEETDLRNHQGNRWLVSDVWFDAIDEAGLPVDNRADSHDQLPAAQDQAFTPTFVVAPPGARAAHSRFSEPHRRRPVSILEIEPRDPAAVVAEVLATCAATRAEI